MAYLEFPETGGAAPKADAVPVGAERLTALEWSVVAIARTDRRASLRPPGRVASVLRALFRQPNPRLADTRLEALRRMAVLTWHHGYTVPSREVRAFLDAGYTAGQYETMVQRVSAATMLTPRTVTA